MYFIFDFDGTLANSKQCSVLATEQAFKQCGLQQPTTQQIEYYMGIPIEQSFKEMADIELSNDAFDQLLTTFRAFYKKYEADTLQLFDGMNEVLQQLQSNAIQCFVLSSKRTEVLKRNLQTLKIDQYFTGIFGSDDVEHYKPHPDGIYKISQKYALNLSDCVMIGDAIFDIQMGKAAGCKTCAVTWGSHSEEQLMETEPDVIVHQVPQLTEIFSIK